MDGFSADGIFFPDYRQNRAGVIWFWWAGEGLNVLLVKDRAKIPRRNQAKQSIDLQTRNAVHQ